MPDTTEALGETIIDPGGRGDHRSERTRGAFARRQARHLRGRLLRRSSTARNVSPS